jgi:glucose-1-phosphatase
MNRSSLLLFDLGGVLIENTGFDALNRMLPCALDIVVLKHQWLESSAVRRFELGKSSPTTFACEFISEWNLAISPDKFLTEFISWPKGFYPQAQDLIRTLRRKYRVGCLSNSNTLHWEKFGGFENEFDFALSSHFLGAIKPDRKAFSRALQKCNAVPHEVYFFDDSLANIHAAKRVGLRAFHTDGFDELQNVLQNQGLMHENNETF